MENYSRKSYKLAMLALFGTFFEFFVLLLTRTHYSIDLFAGLMFSHYYWILSGYIAKKVDVYLALSPQEN
jgi:hypothetical protein